MHQSTDEGRMHQSTDAKKLHGKGTDRQIDTWTLRLLDQSGPRADSVKSYFKTKKCKVVEVEGLLSTEPTPSSLLSCFAHNDNI